MIPSALIQVNKIKNNTNPSYTGKYYWVFQEAVYVVFLFPVTNIEYITSGNFKLIIIIINLNIRVCPVFKKY